MRAIRLVLSAILLPPAVVAAFAVPCSAQGFAPSQIEGLWRTDTGDRWVDVRLLSGGKLIHAWWTCGPSEACRYYGELKRDPGNRLMLTGVNPSGKSLVRLDARDGLLVIDEEISFAAGGGEKSSQVLRRVSDAPGPTTRRVSIEKGQVVRADGKSLKVPPRNPDRRPPDPPGRRAGRPDGYEVQAQPIEVTRLQLPYSPNDQNLPWVQAYNGLLRQILEVFLSPAELNAYDVPSSDYDTFYRRTALLNFITEPRR